MHTKLQNPVAIYALGCLCSRCAASGGTAVTDVSTRRQRGRPVDGPAGVRTVEFEVPAEWDLCKCKKVGVSTCPEDSRAGEGITLYYPGGEYGASQSTGG
jgi:hypothetical protein